MNVCEECFQYNFSTERVDMLLVHSLVSFLFIPLSFCTFINYGAPSLGGMSVKNATTF